MTNKNAILKNWVNKLKFKISIVKLENAYKRMIRCNLRILKFCLYSMNKRGIPTNNYETESLKNLIEFYDANIKDLDESVNRFRNYLSR